MAAIESVIGNSLGYQNSTNYATPSKMNGDGFTEVGAYSSTPSASSPISKNISPLTAGTIANITAIISSSSEDEDKKTTIILASNAYGNLVNAAALNSVAVSSMMSGAVGMGIASVAA